MAIMRIAYELKRTLPGQEGSSDKWLDYEKITLEDIVQETEEHVDPSVRMTALLKLARENTLSAKAKKAAQKPAAPAPAAAGATNKDSFK